MSDFILDKGATFDLSKGISEIYIGAGWKANELENGHPFDVDLSIFLVGADGKMVRTPTPQSGFIGHLFPDAIHHGFVYGGDNLEGSTVSQDLEYITGVLANIGPEVQRVAVTASLHLWRKRKQSFNMISNAYLVLKNLANDEVLSRANLTEQSSGATSLIFGSFYRQPNNSWAFTSEMILGYDGMRGLFDTFGVKVAEEVS